MKTLPATESSRSAPSEESIQRILTERAATLAKAPASKSTAAEKIEIVEFMLAHERYAMETTRLREVQSVKDLTPLPGTPPFIQGIINVRGQIIAVIDLKVFFELPIAALTATHKVMIVDAVDFAGGFLVDAVLGSHELPLTELHAPPPTLSGVRAEYLKGVTRGRVAVLDVARIVADEKLIVNETVVT